MPNLRELYRDSLYNFSIHQHTTPPLCGGIELARHEEGVREHITIPKQMLLTVAKRIQQCLSKEDKGSPIELCEACAGAGMESWSVPFSQSYACVCPDCGGDGVKDREKTER